MDSTSVASELLGLEKQYWQSMIDKDVDTAHGLTDYPCIVTGAQGVAKMDKPTASAMLSASNWSLQEFTLNDNDFQVRLLSDDVAIVAYKVREKLTVEGKPLTLEAADASVWVRRDGRWLCAMHTESLSGDPFGRDRQPAMH